MAGAMFWGMFFGFKTDLVNLRGKMEKIGSVKVGVN